MNKKVIALIAIFVVILLVIGGFCVMQRKGNNSNANTPNDEYYQDSNSEDNSNIEGIVDDVPQDDDELINLVGKIYDKTGFEMMAIENRILNLDEEGALKSFTGLDKKDKIEKVMVSESMIGSAPYSLVMVKVKAGSDVEAIKKEMIDNIDMRKWICVNADKAYATSKDDVIFFVMGKEDNEPKAQFDAFKELAEGKAGKDLEKEFEIDFDFNEEVL